MHALQEGLKRAASAPVIVVGAIAVLVWLRGPVDARNAIAAFVLWTFLSGGILDRYARGRPTRARGFFGACGAHFLPMARLGLIVVVLAAAVHFLLLRRLDDPWVRAAARNLLWIVGIATIYGQVRLVVEDRRSAVGALRAGGRFFLRNPSSIFIVMFHGLLLGLAWRLLPPLAEEVGFGFVMLWMYASGVALFQLRLAHAGYTAAPRIEWPESPAAEAIANAPRSITP